MNVDPIDLEAEVEKLEGEMGNFVRELQQKQMEMAQLRLELVEERGLAGATEFKPESVPSFARQVLDGLAEGVTVVDLNGRFVYLNPAYAQLVGYEIDELLSMSPFDLTIVADHEQLESAQGRRARGLTDQYETKLQTKAGHEVYALITATPYYQEGEVVGSIAAVTDLSRRYQMERTLQESEARYRTIIDSALDAVVLMDQHGSIIGWNPEAEATFGWKKEEVLGQTVAETIVPGSLEEGHRAGLARYNRTAVSHILDKRIEIRAKHREGHEFPVELTVSSLTLEEKTVFVAFIRDISERVQVEVRLKEAKESAEQAALAKASFLASMSHEIRTPLNAIIGLTSLLVESNLEPKQATFVRTMRRSGQTLLGIINNILSYSKLDANKVVLEKIPFVLEPLIRETAGMFTVMVEEKGVVIKLEVDESMPLYFWGDANRLRQIIINLLSNSIKFTDEGEIIIRATGGLEDDGRFRLDVAVIDSGIGIDPVVQEQLFSPFIQGHVSTTRNYGGTGLGLAICQRIVEAMDGDIAAESVLEEGTTFRFSIRLLLASESDMPVMNRGTNSIVLEHPLRILLIEDDSVNQQVILQMLDHLGYDADVANNGLEGVEACLRQPYDLLLMDINMPEMNGLEATKYLREHLAPERQPMIVALTASALPGDRERLLAQGMDDYLSKPMTLEQLRQLLRNGIARLLNLPQQITVREEIPPAAAALDIRNKEQVIDVELFTERIGRPNMDLLRMLVKQHLLDVEGMLPKRQEALAMRQSDEIYQWAHRFKGSSAGIGATNYAYLCGELELAVRGEDWVAIEQLFLQLDEEMGRLERWLEADNQ